MGRKGVTFGKRPRPRGPTPRAQTLRASPAAPPRRRAPTEFYWVYKFNHSYCPNFPVLYYRDLGTSASQERVLASANYRANHLRRVLGLRGRAYHLVTPTVATKLPTRPLGPPPVTMPSIPEDSILQLQFDFPPVVDPEPPKVEAASSEPTIAFTLSVAEAAAVPSEAEAAAIQAAIKQGRQRAVAPVPSRRARPRFGESLWSFQRRLAGEINDKWLPLVYRKEVEFFDVCQYCGAGRETARGRPSHTDISNCPARQEDVRMLCFTRGLSLTQARRLPICTYKFCREPASHQTFVCKTLAHYCRECTLRGCNGVCPVGEAEVYQRRQAFEAIAQKHIYAKGGRGWGQQGPYIPMDKLVFVRSHPDKRGLFVTPPRGNLAQKSSAELALLVEEGLRP